MTDPREKIFKLIHCFITLLVLGISVLSPPELALRAFIVEDVAAIYMNRPIFISLVKTKEPRGRKGRVTSIQAQCSARRRMWNRLKRKTT